MQKPDSLFACPLSYDDSKSLCAVFTEPSGGDLSQPRVALLVMAIHS